MNEARLLRQHIDEVLTKDPNENLLVYGDLNDTKDQPAIQEILGPRQGPNRLKEILLADAQGDRWTYYRRLSDTYDRIDYILADKALRPQIDQSRSYLYRSIDWYSASDHRPVVVVIKTKTPVGTKRSGVQEFRIHRPRSDVVVLDVDVELGQPDNTRTKAGMLTICNSR